jgi:hypothetical protein
MFQVLAVLAATIRCLVSPEGLQVLLAAMRAKALVLVTRLRMQALIAVTGKSIPPLAKTATTATELAAMAVLACVRPSPIGNA